MVYFQFFLLFAIDSKESIPPYALAGRYDNSIPTRLLAPIDCYKIPALSTQISPEVLYCTVYY